MRLRLHFRKSRGGTAPLAHILVLHLLQLHAAVCTTRIAHNHQFVLSPTTRLPIINTYLAMSARQINGQVRILGCKNPQSSSGIEDNADPLSWNVFTPVTDSHINDRASQLEI